MSRGGVLFWFALWLILTLVINLWTSAAGPATALILLAFPLQVGQLVAGAMFLISGFRALARWWWYSKSLTPRPGRR